MNIEEFNQLHLTQKDLDRWKHSISNNTINLFNEKLNNQNINWENHNIQELIKKLKNMAYAEKKTDLNDLECSFIGYLKNWEELDPEVFNLMIGKNKNIINNWFNKRVADTIACKYNEIGSKLVIPERITLGNQSGDIYAIRPLDYEAVLYEFCHYFKISTFQNMWKINADRQKYLVFKNNSPLCLLALFVEYNCYSMAKHDNKQIKGQDFDIIFDYCKSVGVLNDDSLIVENLDDYNSIHSCIGSIKEDASSVRKRVFEAQQKR